MSLVKGQRIAPYVPRPLEIAELQECIVSHLEHPRDIVSLACSSSLLTDCCLRKLWEAPDFPGSPLSTMLMTFPEQVAQQIEHSKDRTFRVPVRDFDRFDYYAGFIRTVTVWHDAREDHIAFVLMNSRPEMTLFPALAELHLAASGEQMITAPAYFSPVLQSIRINYWSLPLPTDAAGTKAVKNALLKLCNTLTITTFDLMDTHYLAFEDDPVLINAFVRLAGQVEELKSPSFIMLAPVFNTLSRNPRLRSILLDLHRNGSDHIDISTAIDGLRSGFPDLRSLSLSCTLEQAVRVIGECKRGYDEINIDIDGSLEAGQLHELATNIFVETPILRHLRVTSASAMECEVDPPIRIFEALQPLLACKDLRYLHILIPFEADQSITDDEMTAFFRAWPELITCIIESDPSSDLIPPENEPTEFGLTLAVVISALAHCSRLTELALPFLNSVDIPDREDVPTLDDRFSLRISRSHVHNLAAVADFITSLRPRAEVSTGGCADFPAARLPASYPP